LGRIKWGEMADTEKQHRGEKKKKRGGGKKDGEGQETSYGPARKKGGWDATTRPNKVEGKAGKNKGE